MATSKVSSCAPSTAYTFTRDAIKQLLLLYEQYPEIYNVQCPEYKNKTIRQDRLVKITKDLNELMGNPGITLQDVKKKLSNLRTQYFHELTKVKKSLVSGAGTDDIYKPSWWCYEFLIFLTINDPVRESESTLDYQITQSVRYVCLL